MQITQHLPKIVDLIGRSNITLIKAPTGSGKSIGIPASLASLGTTVFVTVPTVIAARNLTSQQKLILPQISVGFAAEGEVRYREGKEKLVYVTAGHLRRKLVTTRTDDRKYYSGGFPLPMNFCDVLVVDEAHVESLDNTLILSLWRYTALNEIQVPRLVLLSATLNIDSLIEGPLQGIPADGISIYTVETQGFPVEIRYMPDDYPDLDIDSSEDNRKRYTDASKVAIDLHKGGIDGDMLIFAPGVAEVQTIIGNISAINDPSLIIIPAYSSLTQEDLARLYEPTPEKKRKIIVATNLAESSITINNLGIIIDTLTEKQVVASKSNGTRLILSYVSKSSTIQRTGRTGRTRSGICVRLCNKSFYNSLEDFRVPEIIRLPIYEIVMELLSIGVDPTYIPQITAQRKSEAIDVLTKIGAITDDHRITATGRFIVDFPLSVENAALLERWYKKELPLFPAVVVISLIDCFGPSYFFYPLRKRDQDSADYQRMIDEHRKKMFTKYAGEDDVESLILMWQDMIETVKSFRFIREPGREVQDWTKINSINNKKFREALNIISISISSLEKIINKKIPVGGFTVEGFTKEFRPLLSDLKGALVRSSGDRYRDVDGSVFQLDNRGVSRIRQILPEAVTPVMTSEIATGGGILNIINIASISTILPERKKKAKPLPVVVGPESGEQQKKVLEDALSLLANLGIK